jgi:hypothetical protein
MFGYVNFRKNCVRFHVLTAASMKMDTFWGLAPCVEVDQVMEQYTPQNL